MNISEYISEYDVEFDRLYSLLDKRQYEADIVANENLRRRKIGRPELKTIEQIYNFIGYNPEPKNEERE